MGRKKGCERNISDRISSHFDFWSDPLIVLMPSPSAFSKFADGLGISQIALQITQKMAVESMEQEELCAQVNPEIMSHHIITKEEVDPIEEDALPKLGDIEFNPIGIKVKYFCEFCRGKFESEIVLLQHISVDHEENKYNICTICWKCFGEKSTLKKHVAAIHENKRPHVCQICQNGFHRAAHLRNHISTVHEKKKPFLCTLCGNSYPSDHYLKSHIKSVHEGERRFKCPQCDAKFSQKSGVRTHIECVHEVAKLKD